MVSNCDTKSLREKYVEQLKQYIRTDTFGKCGSKSCSGNRDNCYSSLARTHLFYLAFENSLCDDYITEKFWLPLLFSMVPVVRGPPPEAYNRVAPPHSFIHVDEFAGPKELASYLSFLTKNRNEYGRYHEWRSTHHVKTEWRGLCELCSRLGRGGQNPAVQLSKVWSKETHCRMPRDLDTGG